MPSPKRLRSSISRSSTASNIAYLNAAWEAREGLEPHERTGFGQFFYVFINSYIESQLFALIDLRLEAVKEFARTAVRDLGFRLVNTGTHDSKDYNEREADAHPAFYSIHTMVDERLKQMSNAPVSRLIQLYDSVFPNSFCTVIGENLKKDLDAAVSLRNIFAHGRRTTIEFDDAHPNEIVDFDSSTLKLAAERLRLAKLLSNVVPTSTQSYHTWEMSFFSDAALLYFYGKIAEIDSKLKACSCSLFERKRISAMTELPILLKG